MIYASIWQPNQSIVISVFAMFTPTISARHNHIDLEYYNPIPVELWDPFCNREWAETAQATLGKLLNLRDGV